MEDASLVISRGSRVRRGESALPVDGSPEEATFTSHKEHRSKPVTGTFEADGECSSTRSWTPAASDFERLAPAVLWFFTFATVSVRAGAMYESNSKLNHEHETSPRERSGRFLSRPRKAVFEGEPPAPDTHSPAPEQAPGRSKSAPTARSTVFSLSVPYFEPPALEPEPEPDLDLDLDLRRCAVVQLACGVPRPALLCVCTSPSCD